MPTILVTTIRFKKRKPSPPPGESETQEEEEKRFWGGLLLAIVGAAGLYFLSLLTPEKPAPLAPRIEAVCGTDGQPSCGKIEKPAKYQKADYVVFSDVTKASAPASEKHDVPLAKSQSADNTSCNGGESDSRACKATAPFRREDGPFSYVIKILGLTLAFLFAIGIVNTAIFLAKKCGFDFLAHAEKLKDWVKDGGDKKSGAKQAIAAKMLAVALVGGAASAAVVVPVVQHITDNGSFSLKVTGDPGTIPVRVTADPVNAGINVTLTGMDKFADGMADFAKGMENQKESAKTYSDTVVQVNSTLNQDVKTNQTIANNLTNILNNPHDQRTETMRVQLDATEDLKKSVKDYLDATTNDAKTIHDILRGASTQLQEDNLAAKRFGALEYILTKNSFDITALTQSQVSHEGDHLSLEELRQHCSTDIGESGWALRNQDFWDQLLRQSSNTSKMNPEVPLTAKVGQLCEIISALKAPPS